MNSKISTWFMENFVYTTIWVIVSVAASALKAATGLLLYCLSYILLIIYGIRLTGRLMAGLLVSCAMVLSPRTVIYLLHVWQVIEPEERRTR